MKSLRQASAIFFLMLLITLDCFAARPTVGFFLPESVNEMTLEYRVVKGLVVLPVTINDSIQVNLILDTGCRNLVLFGKKFTSMFKMSKRRPVEFSGLGNGRSVTGTLSLGNKVSINDVMGEEVPVVVVGSSNLFGRYHNVHGVIGYDIFVKFEIELNARARTITFRPALKATAPAGFVQIPLSVVDAKPIMRSEVLLHRKKSYVLDLMIDTGSSLALLLKTTNISEHNWHSNEKILGLGFNGPVSGYQMISESLKIHGLEMRNVDTGIVGSNWHNNASIGMAILKDYIVVLNYCKSYACFKRNDA